MIGKKSWVFKSQIHKVQMHKSKINWVRKSAKCQICGRSAILTNYLSPQICGTYLRTAHLWILYVSSDFTFKMKFYNVLELCTCWKIYSFVYTRTHVAYIFLIWRYTIQLYTTNDNLESISLNKFSLGTRKQLIFFSNILLPWFSV